MTLPQTSVILLSYNIIYTYWIHNGGSSQVFRTFKNISIKHIYDKFSSWFDIPNDEYNT